MNNPIDYPVKTTSLDDTVEVSTNDMTFATLKDRVDAQQPVTDEMIRIARTKLDTAYSDSTTSQHRTGKFKLPKLPTRKA